MSQNVVFNGTTYSIPADGDFGWGAQLTAFFIDIASGSFQKTGGAFTLTAEADFGATYGLKSTYYKSRAANPASAGAVRLGNTEVISWRNAANGANKDLTVSASDILTFGGTKIILSGAIVNADVDAAAAIAYSKLNLSASIVNADVSASAAIDYSKLNLSASIVNADINAAAAIAYSKLNLTGLIVNADIGAAAAIAYSKLNLATSILNADINASAAIALTKLAAMTASRVPVSDGSGFLTPSSVTSTTLGYLDATSSIQTQIDTKAPSASPTFTGTVTVPATITGAAAQVITLPTSTSTLSTLGLNETITGTKTMQSLTVTTNAITLTSGQIAFPATQVASAGANTLDDYEEGTWTPTVTASAGAITAYTSSAAYTKIGNRVIGNMKFQITNIGTASGQILFSGFPFTIGAIGGSSACYEDQATGLCYVLRLISGGTSGGMLKYDGSFGAGSNQTWQFSFTYYV